MSALSNLHEDMSVCLQKIEKTCRHYNYDAKPTLVLRHKDGSSYSIVLGNDDLEKVVQTIRYLVGFDKANTVEANRQARVDSGPYEPKVDRTTGLDENGKQYLFE